MPQIMVKQRTSILEKLFVYLFYLSLILLPTQLGKHFLLQNTLLGGLRIDYLMPTLYTTDVLVVCFMLLAFRLKNKLPKTTQLLIMTICIYGLLQTLWVPLPINHLFFIIRLLLLILFGTFIVGCNKSGRVIAWIFLAQLLMLLLISTLQILLGHNVGGWLYWLGERHFYLTTPGIALMQLGSQLYLRPYGTFSHPNILAGYSLLIMIWLYFYFQTRKSIEKIVKAIAIISGSILVLISYSQAAWIALMLFWLLVIIGRYKQTIKGQWLCILFCISLLIPFILLLIPDGVITEEINLRNQLFRVFISNYKHYLLFGWGWWGSLWAIAEEQYVGIKHTLLQPLHHSWFMIISSVGVVYIGVVTLFLKRHLRSYKTISIQTFTIVAIVLLLGSFDHYWVTQVQTQYLLVFLIGWTMSIGFK